MMLFSFFFQLKNFIFVYGNIQYTRNIRERLFTVFIQITVILTQRLHKLPQKLHHVKSGNFNEIYVN